ncbi:MAG: RagB/SusD family nutrient uptake outer membrane protein [Prevotellaceae bacterium]|jgi:hypothetical protein|nr:RagB/SusD family nutrient uptake outer membrane protein [Prevotellaceae bacterium]
MCYKNKLYKKTVCVLALSCLLFLGACNEYLDVVPEGTGRIENVFTTRENALRYLYSNYYFLESMRVDPLYGLEVTGCGELWTYSEPQYQVVNTEGIRIAEGRQSPYVNLFNRWTHIYAAINNCNTMIAGLETYKVSYLPDWERDLWIAENKVLKAWYHFYLLRMYGPIPIIRENLPVSAGVEEVQVPRESVDAVFEYIVQLLDEAMEDLPDQIASTLDYGRINKAIAMSIKAQALVTAASPLFNCNAEQASLKNSDGLQLFSQDESKKLAKWSRAAQACEEAYDFCTTGQGMHLYHYPGHPNYSLSPEIMRQMTLRQAFCERWSSEVIWAYTGAWVRDLQVRTAKSLGQYEWSANYCVFGVPLSMVEQFYSANGVPIKEDKYWQYGNRYDLRTGTAAENRYIREGQATARMNFDREPRYYAWMAFDRGVYYGHGVENDAIPSNLLYVENRGGRPFSINESGGCPTGYYPKKYIHFQTQGIASEQMAVESYIWPLMRLPELMLYCAEALNEADDTQEARNKAIAYLNLIRDRAELQDVATAWDTYSTNPGKYKTQDGLRQIIHQERTIELAFEGKRYWDLRRWKTAPEILNAPVQGWDISRGDAAYYYRPTTIHEQRFGLKDYFSPISDNEIQRNRKLVQNLGWN